MAIPNPNQITATLRMMGDTQLAQYAAMHKEDPYIFPLAFEESNTRKQVRAAQQAMAMGQPQPKVVDQDLMAMAPQPPMPPQGMPPQGMPPQGMPPQGMPPQGGPQMAQQQLPEHQGIGALAAPNIQHMADGGIAGYAGGGMDEQLAYSNEPVMRMAGGGIARYNGSQSQFVQDLAGIPAAYANWWQRNREEDAAKVAQEQAMAQRRQEVLDARQKTSFANYLFGSPERETQGRMELAELTKPTGTMPEQGYTRPGMKNDPRLNIPPTQPLPEEKKSLTTGEKLSASGSIPRGPAVVAPAAPEQSAAARYAALQKEMGVNDTAKLDAERESYAASLRKAAADEKAAFERDMAERGKYGEGRETRLNAREAELGKEKDQMSGLALIEAGLSIMSTPGTLAQAIGKGAKEGLKSYGEGLAKLKLAKERIDDARDSLEDFRRNEANMTATERRKFESQIGRTESEIKKLAVDAAKDMYGYKRDDTKAVFNADTQTGLAKLEIQGRKDVAAMQERGANARAVMPSGEMRTAMMLGTGTTDAQRLESGMKKLQEITADKSGMAAVSTLAKINAEERKNGEQLTTMQDLLSSARQYATLMYPKVADVPATRERPR